MKQIVCIGVAILDMFPSEYGIKLVDVPYFKPAPGGAPANVAVAAAKLGAKSAFIGKVGDDIFGHHLAEVFAKEGVNIQGMRYDKLACTTMNIHAKPDERTIEYMFYRKPGADTRLGVDELDIEILKNADVLHFDSLNLTDEPTRSATFKAIEIARENGALISFDVNYREPVWPSKELAIQEIKAMIPQADIVKLNEDEIVLLFGDEKLEMVAEQILSGKPQICLFSLGAKGSFVYSKIGSSYAPALKVEVVDTIGCGDAFTAGFLTKLLNIWNEKQAYNLFDLEQSLVYANAVGAFTAQKKGVIPALPSLKDINDFISTK